MNPTNPAIREARAVERVREANTSIRQLERQIDRLIDQRDAAYREIRTVKWFCAVLGGVMLGWALADTWRMYG